MVKLSVLGALRSVRARILASIFIVTTLGMALAGGTAFLVQRERVLAEIDERLQATVDSLQFIAEGSDSGDAPKSVTDFLTLAMQRMLPDHNESVVGIVDGRAALVPASNLSFRLDDDPDFIARVVAEADPKQVSIGTASTTAGTLRYVIIPVSIGADPSTGLYVSAYNLDAELSVIAGAFGTYAVVAAAALVVIVLVGWFVSGRLLRPIRLLRETAARITETDLSERIPVEGRDDVSELTTTVNDMLARLESSFASQRLLLDDVGHELKTPLTIVRGHLELLDPDSPREVSSTRELAIDELDRMSILIDDIALLARSDNPGFLRPTVVDVAMLTESVFAKAGALSADHAWVLADTAQRRIRLDAARITQAWLQLAENAAKYSPAGSAIELGSTMTRTDDDAHLDLWVRDQGVGIPGAQLQRVFERFARAHEGRGVEGSGLGLSIVAAIARAHDGEAFARSEPGAGSLFVIRLPVTGALAVER